MEGEDTAQEHRMWSFHTQPRPRKACSKVTVSQGTSWGIAADKVSPELSVSGFKNQEHFRAGWALREHLVQPSFYTRKLRPRRGRGLAEVTPLGDGGARTSSISASA